MPLTLTGLHVHHADPIKGSRFRATVIPVETAQDATQAIADIQVTDPDATHHCWAYRLGDGTVRSSDDGEPSGSAGRPILARLEGGDWVHVLVVVSRWFGGTKLGVGGLVRAYGRTAGEALARATSVPSVPTVTLEVRHGYGDQGVVTGVLEAAGAMVTDADYGAEIRLTLRVPAAEASELGQALSDATAGRVRTG